MAIYVGLAAIFKNENFKYLLSIAKGFIAKVRKKKATVQVVEENIDQGEITDEQEHC